MATEPQTATQPEVVEKRLVDVVLSGRRGERQKTTDPRTAIWFMSSYVMGMNASWLRDRNGRLPSEGNLPTDDNFCCAVMRRLYDNGMGTDEQRRKMLEGFTAAREIVAQANATAVRGESQVVSVIRNITGN